MRPPRLAGAIGNCMPRLHRIAAGLALALPLTLAFAQGAPAQPLSNEAVFKKLAALAPTGSPEARYHLGMFLNNGIGTPRDNAAAYKLFVQAAEAGHALAAYKVGCYLAGQFPGVVPVDEAEALKFKLRAAEAGYALAQLDVGTMYRKRGEVQNATAWWERASRQGDVQATALLAHQRVSDASADKTQGYALMLVLKGLSPQPPQQLLDHIARVEAELSAEDKARAEGIRSGWLTGKSPLTEKAQAGMAPVHALIAPR